MRLVTEIPMTAGIAFLGIFALLLVIRILISFFEQIRLLKEDNFFIYGIGVAVVYGFIGIVALGYGLG
jgi:hypothetical protein